MSKSKKALASAAPMAAAPRPSVRSILFSHEFLSGAASGVLFFFLLANIVLSQMISPLYFGLLRGDREAAVDFLRTIRHEKFFAPELTSYQRMFSSNLSSEVFAEDHVRMANIKRLEAAYQKNPKVVPVLYSLHLLYLEKKDYERADFYLRRAQELDPTIGK